LPDEHASETSDFFRQRLAKMIDFHHPLVVLASQLPWIEAALTPGFERQAREGRAIVQGDLFAD
jgi:IS5 family transposase